MNNALETIKTIMVEKLGLDADTIKPETTLDNLGVDSLDTIDLILELEDKFKVSISDDAIYGLNTVKNIVDYIEGRI